MTRFEQLDLTPATQYATAYLDGRPIATAQRARIYSAEPAWRLFDTQGREIGDGYRSAVRVKIAARRYARTLAMGV